jgi:integrase
MQGKITKRSVDALEAGQILADKEIKGFVARRLDSGSATYGFRYRDKTTGKQRWVGLGIHGTITADEARGQAKKRAGEVADSRDPVAEREETRATAAREKLADVNTVGAILDKFVSRHVKTLRSGDQVERAFDVYVRPRLGEKSIYDVRRRDVVEMLDAIEDQNGPVMADRVLAHVRKAFNWWAARDDQFAPPIVRGMARTKPAERARTRALADDEIRSVWQALESKEIPEAFRNIVRELLLTAQRRNEVANMHSDEIDSETWIIPAERYKTGSPNVVPLTNEAREWIKGKGYIFSTTGGKRPFSGFSKAKAELDRIITKQRKAAGLKALPNWTLHDLRRTARSLMGRAGVPSEVAEMVLGHAIPGIRRVYDRHSYIKEKREALEKLAGLVALILNPPAGNVVQMARP